MLVREKIKLLRQSRKWSQEYLAEKLGMTTNGYGGIERGEVDIKLSRLQQLSELFSVNLSDLIELGEKTIFNLITTDSGTQSYCSIDSTSSENIKLKCEVEKLQMEVSYLKEIIELMKK